MISAATFRVVFSTVMGSEIVADQSLVTVRKTIRSRMDGLETLHEVSARVSKPWGSDDQRSASFELEFGADGDFAGSGVKTALSKVSMYQRR